MAKEFVCDMTKGNETSLLIRFSLPMLFGNVFQQFGLSVKEGKDRLWLETTSEKMHWRQLA